MTISALVPAAAAAPDVPMLYVLFKIDGADYVLPADVVVQMETYTGATVVPGAPPFVAGIIQLRGRVVPVVDLRARFGLPARATSLETRVVVGELQDRTVALVADSAREVVRIAPSQLKPPPRLIDDGKQGFVKAVAQLGERTVLVLDFAKVIGEESIDV
ncbi:MAG TPA: chemotaxis protein CheW [Labilithrix sp.]|nr:chemotaxis protein CheW [Labilithrix sp.]